MDLNSLTLGQIREIAQLLNLQWGGSAPDGPAGAEAKIDNGMIGKFVIVRCHDAGVHAGYLESYNGRECVLHSARRLWYWKPANGAAFLSGVATEGLDKSSKVGDPIRVHLTENCEIIECSGKAAESIVRMNSYEP